MSGDDMEEDDDIIDYWIAKKHIPKQEEPDVADDTDKYKFIYYVVNGQYLYEFERRGRLDGKANSIIGFVGIITGLQAGLGSFLLKEVTKTDGMYVYLSTIFLAGIIFLTISIFCGLIAFYTKTWSAVPDVESFVSQYKYRNLLDIYKALTRNLITAINANKRINDKKVRYIEFGFASLMCGIIINVLFIYGLLVN